MNNKQDLEKKWQERWERNLSFNTSKKPDEKNPAEKQAVISYFFLIDGTIIAIKLKGIINSKFKCSGINFPNAIPTNEETCQVRNKVTPEPKR